MAIISNHILKSVLTTHNYCQELMLHLIIIINNLALLDNMRLRSVLVFHNNWLESDISINSQDLESIILQNNRELLSP